MPTEPRRSFSDVLRARQGTRHPILAFNIVDLASLQGVLDAAHEIRRPVILQCSARTVEFYGAPTLRAAVDAAIGEARATAFLHLDHCSKDKVLEAAIGARFDGVMADGSHLPYAENVRWTRAWAERAHAAGLVIEGEMVAIKGEEDGHAGGADGDAPDPDEYGRFARDTGVDLLGTDIGTAHGLYATAPRIDFDAVDALAAVEGVGFVVHGASGLDRAALRRLAGADIAKINFSTELKLAWGEGMQVEVGKVPEPIAMLRTSRKAVTEFALGKWSQFSGEP